MKSRQLLVATAVVWALVLIVAWALLQVPKIVTTSPNCGLQDVTPSECVYP